MTQICLYFTQKILTSGKELEPHCRAFMRFYKMLHFFFSISNFGIILWI